MQKTWFLLAMSLGVYLLNSKQADCLYCMKSKSNPTAYRAEIWEQIVYSGYCDVKTTHELIERQTKYHQTKKRCAALELCQLIS